MDMYTGNRRLSGALAGEGRTSSARRTYRASVDKDYSPGNKLISGLRDSAVSWAIILPLYWYCEKGAAVA